MATIFGSSHSYSGFARNSLQSIDISHKSCDRQLSFFFSLVKQIWMEVMLDTQAKLYLFPFCPIIMTFEKFWPNLLILLFICFDFVFFSNPVEKFKSWPRWAGTVNLNDDRNNTVSCVVPFSSITMQSLELSCQEKDVSVKFKFSNPLSHSLAPTKFIHSFSIIFKPLRENSLC